MEETPFSNREIVEKFSDIKEQLDRIESQTTRTNGRVTALENKVAVQKAVTTVGVAIIATLVIPLAVYAFNQATRCADGSCTITQKQL